MGYIEPYSICVLQTVERVIRDDATKDSVIKENVSRLCELISGHAGKLSWPPDNLQPRAKLVVLPEFCVQGSPFGARYARDRRLDPARAGVQSTSMFAVEIPNEATDILGKKAVEEDVYIVGGFLERIENWPGLNWTTAILISPENGKIVLTYRKHCTAMLGYVGPGDVYNEYIKKYGKNLFPVAKTPIGNIAAFVCCDLGFPETARCFALNGVEILCHVDGAPYGLQSQGLRLSMLRARAYENQVYLAHANYGGFKDSLRGDLSCYGRSCIIDWNGRVLDIVDGPGEAAVSTVVNLNALRKLRKEGGHPHDLAALRASLYAKEYRKAKLWPLNAFSKKNLDSVEDWIKIRKKVSERLFKKRIWERLNA